MNLTDENRLTITTWGGMINGQPAHKLTTFDCGRLIEGRYKIGYRLETVGYGVVFEGDDYSVSRYTVIDGIDTVRTLLGFLTLKPGDVGSDFFDKYTEKQMGWVHEYAEYIDAMLAIGNDEDDEEERDALFAQSFDFEQV